MPLFVTVPIFEDLARELAFEVTRLNGLIDGTITADLSGLTNEGQSIVQAINQTYPRFTTSISETVKIPMNSILVVPEVLYLGGLLINDGMILEV